MNYPMVVDISCDPLNGSPFHQKSPRRFYPRGVPRWVLQPEKALGSCSDKCHANQPYCILSITVEQVKEAVLANLLR